MKHITVERIEFLLQEESKNLDTLTNRDDILVTVGAILTYARLLEEEGVFPDAKMAILMLRIKAVIS